VEVITSTRNPRVREVASLSRRKERRASGRHLVEGPGPVAAALRSGVVEELWGTEEALARHPEVTELVGEVAVIRVADHVLERVADARTPQGLVAIAATRTATLHDVVGQGLLVVLDAVADPGNLGTIIRTADATGAAGVVLTPGCVDAFGPKAVRAAAGSTYHVAVAQEVTMEELTAACRAQRQPVLGLDGGASRSIEDLPTDGGPLALVLGNEAHGLDPATVALLDDRVAIPIRGQAESFNVAAAAAIAIYLAARGVGHAR